MFTYIINTSTQSLFVNWLRNFIRSAWKFQRFFPERFVKNIIPRIFWRILDIHEIFSGDIVHSYWLWYACCSCWVYFILANNIFFSQHASSSHDNEVLGFLILALLLCLVGNANLKLLRFNNLCQFRFQFFPLNFAWEFQFSFRYNENSICWIPLFIKMLVSVKFLLM